jgi:hypothetical protein
VTFKQLEDLWIRAGGSPSSAPTAAAIALAESGGRPDALNDNPATGDYSVGLWQINYYGPLRSGRTRAFGPPEALTDPLKNAQAAVALSSAGASFSPWSTYKSGAYISHLKGGGSPTQTGDGSIYQAPPRPTGNTTYDASFTGKLGAVTGFVGDLPVVGGIVQGAKDATDAVKLLVWLLSPKHWLQMLEVLVGVLMLGYGFAVLGSGSGSGSAVKLSDVPLVGSKAKGARRAAAVVTAKEARATELHQVRVKTEKARATELRTRTKHRRRPRQEQEAAERRAYIRGATDQIGNRRTG